jgi:hypothetical protein
MSNVTDAVIPSPRFLLRIGVTQTTFVPGAAAPGTDIVLNLGTQTLAEHHFHHSPPTPLELENAIVEIEDEIARLRVRFPSDAWLCSTDPMLRTIACLAGLPGSGNASLAQDSMERVFDRLASVSLGRPSSQDFLPTDTTFAATLLILRELMHHLGFAAMVVTD